MNIFVLDRNPVLAARYHGDKHVVKMILETAQLLSTALHELGIPDVPYKPTHLNHPCAVWTRHSRENFYWLGALGYALCFEYRWRYDKVHKSQAVIDWACQTLIDESPLPFPETGLTPFALAMPEQYRSDDPVESYRRYYIQEKLHIATYKRRDRPVWLPTIPLEEQRK